MKATLTRLVSREAESVFKADEETRIQRATLAAAKYTSANRLGKVTEVASHADVYELLGSGLPEITLGTFNVLILRTCGWAAPADDNECAPSVHPDRRRVALVYAIDTASGLQVSAIRMAGNDQTIISTSDDETVPQGALADALNDLATRILERSK